MSGVADVPLRRATRRAHAIAALALWLIAAIASAAPLPAGTGTVTFDLDGTSIEVHTYKPAHYRGAGLLVVLHGTGRNAAGMRDYAMALADRLGWVVAAPLFDRERFPPWRYQWGGMVRERLTAGEQRIEPEARWLGHTLLTLVHALRSAEGAPRMPYALVGHSGGAQALGRIAAFIPTEARSIVLANPGTHLWPTREARFPFGFGGLPARLADDAVLRRYLAQPIVILLGTMDVRQGEGLNTTPAAMAQGAHRYERGLNAYRAASAVAKARGWPFGWRLFEVPGVGHSGRRMLESEQAARALTTR